MRTIDRDIWLCEDCVNLTSGDSSDLSYYYSDKPVETEEDDVDGNPVLGPSELETRLTECEEGLAELGSGLVPDWDIDETVLECTGCGFCGTEDRFIYTEATDEEDSTITCHKCRGQDVQERDSGYEEFSRRGCDCCGSTLAGAFHRYAIIGEDIPGPGDQFELTLTE